MLNWKRRNHLIIRQLKVIRTYRFCLNRLWKMCLGIYFLNLILYRCRLTPKGAYLQPFHIQRLTYQFLQVTLDTFIYLFFTGIYNYTCLKNRHNAVNSISLYIVLSFVNVRPFNYRQRAVRVKPHCARLCVACTALEKFHRHNYSLRLLNRSITWILEQESLQRFACGRSVAIYNLSLLILLHHISIVQFEYYYV
jgi:hypothetical protein